MRNPATTGFVDIRVHRIGADVVELSITDRKSRKWPATICMTRGDSVRVTFHLESDGSLEEAYWVKGTFKPEGQ